MEGSISIKQKIMETYKLALEEIRAETMRSDITLSKIAERVHKIYCRNLPTGEKMPSYWTILSYLSFQKSDAHVQKLMEGKGFSWRVKIDPALVFKSFKKAIGELKGKIPKEAIRPRRIARRAHQLYCADLSSNVTPPSLSTFTKRVCKEMAWPRIQQLLKTSGIQAKVRVKLDRPGVLAAFLEAAEKLSCRTNHRKIRPALLAHFAFRLYVRDLSENEPRPSHHSFLCLIYGKKADPEILRMIGEKLNRTQVETV